MGGPGSSQTIGMSDMARGWQTEARALSEVWRGGRGCRRNPGCLEVCESGGVVSSWRAVRCRLAVLLELGGRETQFDLESRAVVPRRPRKVDPRAEGMPLGMNL